MCVQKVGVFRVVLPLPESFEAGLALLSDVEEVGVRPTPVSDSVGHSRYQSAQYELVTFGRDIGTDEALDFLRLHGRRSANALETLAFIREHSRVCAVWPIACLGTVFLSSCGGPRSTPYGVERRMCIVAAGSGGRFKLMYTPSTFWPAKVAWTVLTISLI